LRSGYFSYVFLNERYLYLASAGFFLLAASALENAATALLQRHAHTINKVLATFAAAGFLISFQGTWGEARILRDPERLWARTARLFPDSLTVRNILGCVYLDENKPEEAL